MTEKTSPAPSVDAGRLDRPSAPAGADAAASGASAARIAPRDQRVIWLLLAATFVVILNETIMTVAIPKLMDDLHIDALAAQWLSTAFMLTMAVVIPITGILLQRYSTRQMFIAAMSLFSLGTLAAALSPGFMVLVGARVIQASGTAIMIPLLMTTLMTLVPPAMRGRTMGNVSIVISVAPAIGPTISGLILNFLTWRWIFLIVLPIALVMLLIGMRFVENVTETKKVRIDVLSVILSAFGFGGLVYGLTLSGESGAASASPLMLWGSLIVGVLGLAAFITRQLILQRKDRALLDLRTFRYPIFTVSIVLMAITTASMFGVIIVLPLYLQHVLHLTTLATGLILLPGGLIMGLAAPFVGRLYDRFDPRVLVVPGLDPRQPGAVVPHDGDREHTRRPHHRGACGDEPRSGDDVHAAVHRGSRRGSAAPVLARQRHPRNHPAGRWRGGHGSPGRRPDAAGDRARGRRGRSRRGAGRGHPCRLRRRRDHLAVRRGRVVLHPQARRRTRRGGLRALRSPRRAAGARG